jgi:enoyl-CoA hydratase/carnithine racemase
MPEVRVELLSAQVQGLTLVHVEKRNAVTAEQLARLSQLLAEPAPRARVLRGAGDAFCAGYDLQALAARTADTPLPDVALDAVCEALAVGAPSIAAVDGPAFGAGCELALACDVRIATSRASFCMPPAKLGVVYSLGGIRRVVEKVGLRSARWLFLTANTLSAREALAYGLIDEICEVEALSARALSLAEHFASLAPQALAGLKRGLRLAAGGATPEAIAAYEDVRQASFNGPEAREGVRAALERRRPQFD